MESISDVKKAMTDAFVADSTVVKLYGLDTAKSFDEQFSKVSLESILFYVVASAVWICVQTFARHKIDIEAAMCVDRAHTPGWYASRAKMFQYGCDLGDDGYDNSLLAPDQIARTQIVKFSAAVESPDCSILYLKIAADGKKSLEAEQFVAFSRYVSRVKDAGVNISVINSPADQMKISLDVYYNPLVMDGGGKLLDGTSDTPVKDAVRAYISNLPFNGKYVNQTLIDTLQKVTGVEIAELRGAWTRFGEITQWAAVNAIATPHSGYYAIEDENLTINYKVYE